MLGGEIPVELLWGFPQARQPFVLLKKIEINGSCYVPMDEIKGMEAPFSQ